MSFNGRVTKPTWAGIRWYSGKIELQGC